MSTFGCPFDSALALGNRVSRRGGMEGGEGEAAERREEAARGKPEARGDREKRAKCRIKLWNPVIICLTWSHLSRLSLVSCWWVPLDRDCVFCVPLLHSGKGLIKSVVSDNISVLQNYHPQHGDIFLTGMSKIKLTSV